MVEGALEHLFFVVIFRAQEGVHEVVYEDLELVIFESIRAAMLGQNINKNVDKYFEVEKDTEALCRRLLDRSAFLALIPSFV